MSMPGPAAAASAGAGAGGGVSHRLRERVLVYARLSNLSVYFHWVPALVALAMLRGVSARTALTFVLLIAGVICVASSGGALDDVSGLRDGIDQTAYDPDETLRSVTTKPLVLGQITEAAALRFAFAIGALGILLGSAGIALAPHMPAWAWPVWLVMSAAGIQYSYGLKLSYHGLGELVLGASAAATVLLPYALATGAVSSAIAFESFLTGSLFYQVTVFSSSQDRDVDRQAGRITMAARLADWSNRLYIVAVFAVSWTVIAFGFAGGALRPVLAVALVPTWVHQIGQLVLGVGRRQWLRARATGWRAFRLGLLAMIVVNALTVH